MKGQMSIGSMAMATVFCLCILTGLILFGSKVTDVTTSGYTNTTNETRMLMKNMTNWLSGNSSQISGIGTITDSSGDVPSQIVLGGWNAIITLFSFPSILGQMITGLSASMGFMIPPEVAGFIPIMIGLAFVSAILYLIFKVRA